MKERVSTYLGGVILFPSFSLWGLDLYSWMLIVGLIASLISFRILTDRFNLNTRLYNFSLLCGLGSVFLGFLFAALFQTFYHYLETHELSFNAGITFYGGLMGGIISFLILYFGLGKFIFKDNLHKKKFFLIAICAFCSVIIAHAFGRIGCFLIGCCYGKRTESFIGLNFVINGNLEKRIPVQLYEACFLFGLYILEVLLIVKKDYKYGISLYFISYGIFRFLIEYLRDDDRGSSILPFFTPSQFNAILFIVIGIILLLLLKRKENYHEKE